MFESPAARATLRLSCAVFVVAAFAAGWEALAQQAPGSLFYLGVLPSPIQSLRESAFMLGLLTFCGALLASSAGSVPRGLVVALHVGVVCAIGSALYGAITGLHGEQIIDMRPDALPLFVIKHAGYLDVFGVLGVLGLRVLRGPRST
jgi:hypothetical protein